jgi:Na+/H+-dicarboxylate symporter
LLKVALVDHHLNIPEALAAILKYPLLLLPLASLGAILVGWIIADSGENGKHDINDVKIFAERIGDVASEVLKCVLWAAPLAVGAAAAEFFARDDSADATIVSLFTLLFTASALFVLIELVLARLPLEFFGATRRSVRRGFTTTSSELALNDAFQDMDEEGVPRNISDFVLTTGTNFNLGGSALYVALAVAFVQKAVSNPTPLEYLQTLVLLLGTTRLVAPIPRASITVIITTLGFGGLLQPKADYYLGVIFGMDFVCDALRTAVNVFSNCVCAKWVAVSEDSGLRTNSRENKSESST